MTTMCSNNLLFNSAQYRRLSDSQCQKLYWACLELLERTGVRLYHQEALDLLKKAGVSASDGNRVRLPPGLVEKALTTEYALILGYDDVEWKPLLAQQVATQK